MRDVRTLLIPLVALVLALCLNWATISRSAESDAKDSGRTDIEKQRKDVEQQVRPNIEKQRQAAEQDAQKALDKEAIAAIEETEAAVKALSKDNPDKALAAIERAIGKINVLTARNPATALIPVSVTVEVIDAAPSDIKAIRDRARDAETAVGRKDYPTARVLLTGLMSEIRVRTTTLPLATYPVAMKEAARLIDQQKTKEASKVLLTALNTLVVVDRVTPLPLALTQSAIEEAQQLREQDKEAAQARLTLAKIELERAKELGYAGNDPEYTALHKTITDLENQLKGKEDTASAFSRLTEKVASFFKRQSESERR
jgi:hypothetical protein